MLATIGLLLAAAATCVVIAFAWFDVSLDDGVGDNTYTPSALANVQPTYDLGVGDLRIDLSQVGPVTRRTPVNASVGVGRVRVIVPRGAAVAVDARTKVGEICTPSGTSTTGATSIVRLGPANPLVIHARVGAGPHRHRARRMTQIPVLPFERSRQDRVLAGVCGGLAATLGVDADARPPRLRDSSRSRAAPGSSSTSHSGSTTTAGGSGPPPRSLPPRLSLLLALGVPGSMRARRRA